MTGRIVLLLALAMMASGCACGEDGKGEGEGDADADADGDADTDADSDADADGDVDADTDADGDGDGDGDADADADGDADPCVGDDTLTVAVTVLGPNWVLNDADTMAGVDVAVDCGGTRREDVTDGAGLAVFGGLSLADAPVDVTAHHPDTDALTVLGVGDASQPLAIQLRQLGPLDVIEVNGPIDPSQGGSVSIVSLPGGGAGSFDDDYRISFFPAEDPRLVAIEYVVDADDVASPIGYFDETFPLPDADGPGPEITYAAATFDEDEIEVTVADDLLADRARPTNDPEHRRWYRAHLGVVVHDVDPFLGTWNVLGMTTEVESGAGSDVLHVTWNDAAIAGDVQTLVRVGDAELRVGAAATRAGSPADVGDLDVPAPPRFAGAPFAEPVPLGPADLEIERPDWAVGPLVVRVEGRNGGEPLYGQDFSQWTVIVPEGATTFHLPAPPASRSTTDVLGPAELRLVLVATNGVDPFAGVHWMAFDARPSAIAQ